MESSWKSGACNERAGFLFSHDCSRVPIHSCVACQRPICEKHAHESQQGMVCTTCAKAERKQQTTRDDYDDDDPYFYGDGYYRGYGRYRPGRWGYAYIHHHHHSHDPNDFTEADEAAVEAVADNDFEMDMGES